MAAEEEGKGCDLAASADAAVLQVTAAAVGKRWLAVPRHEVQEEIASQLPQQGEEEVEAPERTAKEEAGRRAKVQQVQRLAWLVTRQMERRQRGDLHCLQLLSSARVSSTTN